MSIARIYPPDGEDCETWDVIADLRFDDHYDNHDLGTAVGAEARSVGLKFEEDHESSCSYFYADDEATAKAIADICDRLKVVHTIRIDFKEAT